jgi:CRP/FNR family transcriptional regulator
MNLSQTTDFLKSVRLFQDLDDTQRYTLAQEFNSIGLKDGEELYQEGKPGGDFYIITSGKIHLARWENETELSIGDMGASEFLGHDSFLDGSHHAATARAIGNCTLLTVDSNQFGWILDQHPEIEEELKFLARSYKISRRSMMKLFMPLPKSTFMFFL